MKLSCHIKGNTNFLGEGIKDVCFENCLCEYVEFGRRNK